MLLLCVANAKLIEILVGEANGAGERFGVQPGLCALGDVIGPPGRMCVGVRRASRVLDRLGRDIIMAFSRVSVCCLSRRLLPRPVPSSTSRPRHTFVSGRLLIVLVKLGTTIIKSERMCT